MVPGRQCIQRVSVHQRLQREWRWLSSRRSPTQLYHLTYTNINTTWHNCNYYVQSFINKFTHVPQFESLLMLEAIATNTRYKWSPAAYELEGVISSRLCLHCPTVNYIASLWFSWQKYGGHPEQMFWLSDSFVDTLRCVAYPFQEHACIFPLCTEHYCHTKSKSR